MEKHRKAVLARISGRVQGVSFRAWALREAEGLGLTGWVRNEPDGSVTALLVGSEPAVAAMIGKLQKGPSGAAVSRVAVEDVEAGETPVRFSITG